MLFSSIYLLNSDMISSITKGLLNVIPAILIDVLIVATAFLILNYSKYVKLEKYCLFLFIVLKIILSIKNNSTLQ